MNWKPTWILVGLAAGLLAFILLFERSTPEGARPPARFVDFRSQDVTNIQVRLTNHLLLRVERAAADAPWVLADPITYPAQPHAIEWLLAALEQEMPAAEISPQDLKAAKRSVAEFGLDLPQATLTLLHKGRRTEVSFGAHTPVGEGVYAQVSHLPGIFLVHAELSDRLPRSHHDWRNTALFSTSVPLGFDGVEARANGRGFGIAIDKTNSVFVLTKPTVARADPGKVDALLRRVLSTEVKRFVTDSPRVELEAYGLQPPELEMALMHGTNEQMLVQFGRSPTNDPGLVYARRSTHTNIVLVPRSTLEALQVSHSDLRDLHLVVWGTNQVDAIEVLGAEGFAVRRQTNGTWATGEATLTPADGEAVKEWLDALSRLEGTVEKDVVTDFANPYGLSPPARRYVLKSSSLTPSGSLSNRVVAELQLGRRQEDKIFARRPDGPDFQTVYSITPRDVIHLPSAPWQLRDRRVWSFTTNQVVRVTVRHEGRRRVLQRSPNRSWSIAEGAGTVIGAAVEELMFRLGELRAYVWVAEGESKRGDFGFTADGDYISIELANGDAKGQALVLEFSTPTANIISKYALAIVDGHTSIFEFPPALQFEVFRVLISPLFRLQ